MEKGILNKLEWNLTVPTRYVFLVRFLKTSMCDKEMEHMVFFFAELGLMQYSMIIYCPSMVAASAVYAARCTLRKSPLWTETLKRHTGFSEQQLLAYAVTTNFLLLLETPADAHANANQMWVPAAWWRLGGDPHGGQGDFGDDVKATSATTRFQRLGGFS